jgi:hypothetical protein
MKGSKRALALTVRTRIRPSPCGPRGALREPGPSPLREVDVACRERLCDRFAGRFLAAWSLKGGASLGDGDEGTR